jgi:single stranded DNA-binding protein
MLAHRPVETGFVPDPATEQTSNRVDLTGYVGREALVRYTADERMVASVSLATHHWHDEDGASVQTTDWHHVVAYDEAANLCSGLRPGDLVRVSGRLHTHAWRDRFGAHHQRTEVVAEEVTRVHRRPVQLTMEPRPTSRFTPSAS